MYKGFYDLTSAMLTQTRNLDVIGNNMSNTATTGYKADRYADTTFDEVMRSRVGNKQKAPQALGTTTSYITALDEVYTDHSQGGLEQTGLPFDFAIEGEGYFAVQSASGRVYTRNGSLCWTIKVISTLLDKGAYWDRTDSLSIWGRIISLP